MTTSAFYSLAQVYAAVRTELRNMAERFEAEFATRDTNDGTTYCGQCGAPQPKRGRRWRHDGCPVATLRERVAELEKADPPEVKRG